MTTIDTAGRLVIPKRIREAAGLEPGLAIEVRLREGHVELEPAPRDVRLERRGRLSVAVPVESGEPLRDDQVRATAERLRASRSGGGQ